MAFEQEISGIKREMMSALETRLDQALWADAADQLRKLKFIEKLEQELALLEEQWEL